MGFVQLSMDQPGPPRVVLEESRPADIPSSTLVSPIPTSEDPSLSLPLLKVDTETTNAETVSWSIPLSPRVGSTNISRSLNTDETRLTSMEPDLDISRTDIKPNARLSDRQDYLETKVLVVVEIDTIGKRQVHLEEFGSDPLRSVYHVIHALRDSLLQDAAIESSDLILLNQSLSASSSNGLHTMGLTSLFLQGVLDEVINGSYHDPLVDVKYAVRPSNPEISALQQAVRKELNDSAFKMETGSIIPTHAIENILTTPRICTLVSAIENCNTASLELAEHIRAKALRALAMLILAGVNPAGIPSCSWRQCLEDQNLPFRQQASPPPFMSRSVYQAVCSVQWTLLTPVLQKSPNSSGAWPAYDREHILPFIDRTPINSGGFGQVFKIKLHPSHHLAQEVSDKMSLRIT